MSQSLINRAKMTVIKCLCELDFDFGEFLKGRNYRKIFQCYCYLFSHFLNLHPGKFQFHVDSIHNSNLTSTIYDERELSYFKSKADSVEIEEIGVGFLEYVKTRFKDNSDLLEVYCCYHYLTKHPEEFSLGFRYKTVWDRVQFVNRFVTSDNLSHYQKQVDIINVELIDLGFNE